MIIFSLYIFPCINFEDNLINNVELHLQFTVCIIIPKRILFVNLKELIKLLKSFV